jgi:putative secretion ATPase (PEP-CTERM system associated)
MYQAFYKLHGKPFQLTPDPGMLFPSHGHQRAMAYLLYGLEQGEGFVLITGAVGTGKTLLIQKLVQELAHRDIAMASIASANLDGGDILPAVASALALPFEQRGKERLLQDIKQRLIALQARHTQALLVVDEAQTLSVAALEMLRILSNFEIDGRALLQVFLVGQTELRRTIANHHMEQLRQRIIASHHLEPLDAEEGRAYILHRLNAVGWNHDPEIAPEVLDAVCRAAGGIPRRVNLIMDRLLLHGYLEALHQFDGVALNLVLDEIGDEMDAAKLSTQAGVAPRGEGLAGAVAVPGREAEYAELLRQRDNLLPQLMRVQAQLKDVVAAGSETNLAAADSLPGDLWRDRKRPGGAGP